MHSLTIDVPAYPPAVLRAYTAVFQHQFFKSLTAKTREVLGEIVMRLKQHDATEPVWFKRENVADKLACDRKTVYNALTRLERLGLIEREEQIISADGNYQCARIAATRDLATLLGLPFRGGPAPAQGYPQPAKPGDLDRGEKSESNNGGTNNPLRKQPSGGFSPKSPIQNRPPKNEGRAPRLWDDQALAFLLSAGLSRFGIFALMGLCKANGGQRLSTIVDCVRPQLEKIARGKAFAYLRACILSGKDFSAVHAEHVERNEAEAVKQRRREFVARFAGQRLKAQNGNIVKVMDGACEWFRADGSPLGSTGLAEAFDAWDAGKLIAVG